MMAYIGVFKGEIDTYLPIVRLLFAMIRALVGIGIIVTNDDLRVFCQAKFHCFDCCFEAICRNENQIHVITE